MAFDNFITDITQDKIVPMVTDTVLTSNVVTLKLLGNPAPWAGESMKIPVQVSASTSGGSFTGYETFDTTRQNVTKQMSFSPKANYWNVTLSNLEIAANRNAGNVGVIDVMQLQMEIAKNAMADEIGDQIYGDGTGNGSADILGLVAAVDDGTNVATYGGLSRTTYTTLRGNYTASVGNITLSGMATMYDSCQVGMDAPDLIVTTPTVWTYYESLAQAAIVINTDGYRQVTRGGMVENKSALKGELGFDALAFRGAAVVKDEKCTSGYMYFLNTKYLKWYTLPHPKNTMVGSGSNLVDGVYSQSGEKTPVFSWTGWKEGYNQDATVGQFILYGELINRNPNRSGVLRGITGV